MCESKRQHRQINALQAHNEKPEQGREKSTCQGGGDQRRFHWHAELRHQKPTRIGAKAEISGMAKAYDPAIAHQEIQRKGGKGEDQYLGRDLDRIGIAKNWHGSRRQHSQQQKQFLGSRKAARLHDALRQGAMSRRTFWPAKQAPGLHHQHQRHQQEHKHKRDFWKYQHAESLQLPNQQRRQKGTSNGAHATNHCHHKGFSDDGKIHLRGCRNARYLQGATKPRQKGAQEQCTSEKQSLIDTKRAHHVAVPRCSA